MMHRGHVCVVSPPPNQRGTYAAPPSVTSYGGVTQARNSALPAHGVQLVPNGRDAHSGSAGRHGRDHVPAIRPGVVGLAVPVNCEQAASTYEDTAGRRNNWGLGTQRWRKNKSVLAQPAQGFPRRLFISLTHLYPALPMPTQMPTAADLSRPVEATVFPFYFLTNALCSAAVFGFRPADPRHLFQHGKCGGRILQIK